MTLLAIRTEIQEVSGRTDKDTIIDDCINAAAVHLGTRYKHPPLQMTSTMSTVDGDATYLLPDNCFSIFYVRESTTMKTVLEDATIEDYQKESRDSTYTGTPSKWARYNQLLYIFSPPPNGVYEIEMNWWKRHPALSADADEHLYFTEWEQALRLMSAEYFFVKMNEHQKAATVRSAFDRYLQGRGLGKDTERGYKHNAGFSFGP